jgi:hypothetical protein
LALGVSARAASGARTINRLGTGADGGNLTV